MAKKTDPAERFRVHKKECSWTDSLGRVVPGDHGTSTQYGRALRVGAEPCQPCKDANTAKDLAWRRANARKKKSAGKAKAADHVAAQRAKATKAGPQPKPTTKATRVG